MCHPSQLRPHPQTSGLLLGRTGGSHFPPVFSPLANLHPGQHSGTDSALSPQTFPVTMQGAPTHPTAGLPTITGHFALSSPCACISFADLCSVLAHPDPWPSLLPDLPPSNCWAFIPHMIHPHLSALSTGPQAKVFLQPGCYPAPSLMARPSCSGLRPLLGLWSSRTHCPGCDTIPPPVSASLMATLPFQHPQPLSPSGRPALSLWAMPCHSAEWSLVFQHPWVPLDL